MDLDVVFVVDLDDVASLLVPLVVVSFFGGILFYNLILRNTFLRLCPLFVSSALQEVLAKKPTNFDPPKKKLRNKTDANQHFFSISMRQVN